MKKYLITAIFTSAVFLLSLTVFVKQSQAQSAGDCVNGYTWVCGHYAGVPDEVCYADGNQPCGSRPVVGGVAPPPAISAWRFANGGYSQIGIINFISMLIRLFTIIAGIFAMLNFVLAGFTYVINAGSSDVNAKVKDKLTYSVIGLAIVVSAYTIAGLIGLIFFSDASYILAPKLEGALAPP